MLLTPSQDHCLYDCYKSLGPKKDDFDDVQQLDLNLKFNWQQIDSILKSVLGFSPWISKSDHLFLASELG